MSLRTMLLVVITSLAVARVSYTQVPASNEKTQTPSDAARFLVGRRAAVPVPAQGRVKLSIKKEAQTFAMPGGPSSVVLLQLSDYQGPYVVRIASSRRGIGRTTEIFVPSGFYLDADFRQLDEFGENQLAERVESLVAELAIDESRMDARYLLLYTHGDLVGQQVVVLVPDALDGRLTRSMFQSGLFRVERSLEASLRVETKMRPGFKGVQTKSQPEVVRALVDQGAVVRLPSVGKVKHSIATGAPTFTMGGGPSSVVVLQLPEYSAPYHLRIESSARRSKGIFIPSGVYFDASFQPLGQFGEDRLTGKDSVTAELVLGERDRTARYLLLYTRGDRVGLSVRRTEGLSDHVAGQVLECAVSRYTCGIGATGPLYWVERSLEARLEMETMPDTGSR